MSKIDAPSVPGPRASREARRDGLAGFIALIVVALAVAIAAVALLARDAGEPVVLLLLAALAAAGMFYLFATAIGLVRIGEAPAATSPVEAYLATGADGVQIRRADGRVIYANEALRGLLGPGFDPSLGIEDTDGLGPAASEALFRLSKAAAGGYEWEEEIERPSGEGRQSRWLRISVTHLDIPEPGAGRGVRHAAWRVEDRSPARRDEIAGDARPASAAALVDALPFGLAFLDPAGRLAGWNTALADLAGLGPAVPGDAPATARPALADLVGPAAAATILATPLPRLSQRDGQPPGAELRLADGARLPVRLVFRRDSDPSALGTIAFVPVEPRPMPAETAPEPSEARLARYFDAAPVAIATIDRSGRILSANSAFTRMFAGSGEQARPGRQRLGDLVDPRSRAQLDARLGEGPAAADGQPLQIAFGQNGERIGRLYLSAIASDGEAGGSAIVYAIDATEQRDLEIQFAQSQKMQAVGQLAGGIAHDFNNVLTVIIGSSDLLLANHRPTDPAFRDIVAIKQNANRAAGLVRQLLAFSRRQTLRPEVLLLNDVISDLSILLSRLLGERVRLKVAHGRDLWYVKADVTQFEQVIINLCVNARDAMPDGGRLTVRTYNLSREETQKLRDKALEPGDYVACEVSDTGTGMPAEVLAKIFEPFFTTKEVGKGTGLGLSTVYGIVKQTGGYIYCDSTPGKGTTFRIYLPRFVSEPAEAAPSQRGERREKSRDLTGTGTVLLVEDEEAVRRIAARALARQGYQVLEAGTGAEALDVLAEHDGRVDLVVSDIVMPEMDGPTLLKALRKVNPEMKIIFISGYAEDALKSLEGGEEFQFLPKPFQLKELVAVVKETLGG
ncbi:MAG: response regulator [Hyphomicrobiaceae bacterium]